LLVAVRARKADGNLIESINFQLAAGEKKVDTAVGLFGGLLPQGTAWLEIASSGSPITAFELFGTHDGWQLAGIPGFRSGANRLYISHIAQDDQWWTGIGLVNIGGSNTNVNITAYDTGGNPLGNAPSFSLAAHGKKVDTASGLFGNSLPEGTAWMEVNSSSAPVAGFVLFGSQTYKQCCDFDSGGDFVERCFGGIGSKCNGIPDLGSLAPIERDDCTCMVTGYISAGSILHDQCCLRTKNEGHWCRFLQIIPTECKDEWDEAWRNAWCTNGDVPRKRQISWGPYKCGNLGDDTNKPIYLPPCTGVNAKYKKDISYLCQFGYELDANGNPRINTDACGDYYVCADECSNIAGVWNYSNWGTITCTYAGETETEYPSESGMITINQNDCNISWTEPVYNVSRSGPVSRNRIEVSGVFAILLVSGVNINQNRYTAKGTFSCIDNKIELSGSGIATGTYEGESFSCTGTDTVVFTRSSSKSISQSIVQKAVNKKSPRLFLNNSLRIFTIVSPIGE